MTVVVGSLCKTFVHKGFVTLLSKLIINRFNKRSHEIPSLFGFINITVIGCMNLPCADHRKYLCTIISSDLQLWCHQVVHQRAFHA